ncbi:hypothetical protein M3J09_013216 [Ascochyta lentis]
MILTRDSVAFLLTGYSVRDTGNAVRERRTPDVDRGLGGRCVMGVELRSGRFVVVRCFVECSVIRLEIVGGCFFLAWRARCCVWCDEVCGNAMLAVKWTWCCC